MKCHIVLDIAIVIRIDQAIRKRVAQEALIRVAVRVDESRNDDAIRRIDDGENHIGNGDGTRTADHAAAGRRDLRVEADRDMLPVGGRHQRDAIYLLDAVR